ncbi:MAG: TRAP transporter small permease [Dethiobacteria bacterium]|nr:TRAP transporter small permease [Bacillota bacterium]
MKFYEKLENIGSKINSVLEKACVFLLIIMTVIVLAQVFYRYVLRLGLPWAEEIAKYLMVWMALLGAAIVFYEQSHVSIDFLIDKISFKKWFKAGHTIVAMILFVFFIIYGFDYAKFGLRSFSATTKISRFWPYLAIPIGGIFLFIQGFIVLVRFVAGKEEQKELEYDLQAEDEKVISEGGVE